MSNGGESQEKSIVFDVGADGVEEAQHAIEDPEILAALIDALSLPERRVRQFAAMVIREVAREKPELLIDRHQDLVDALHRPEAQTRWEMLESLGRLATIDESLARVGLEGAETSLYDESSGTVRLTAFRYLARVGSISPEMSDEVWYLLDEAIQCYHGDNEFQDMLDALKMFATGNISEVSRKGLIERMAFDAEFGKSYIKREAAIIIALSKGERLAPDFEGPETGNLSSK